MEIKKELEELIINLGALDYDAERIAILINKNKSDVEKELKNKNSKLYTLIKKGKNISEYIIDLKLFELAKIGDLKALEKLEERKLLR